MNEVTWFLLGWAGLFAVASGLLMALYIERGRELRSVERMKHMYATEYYAMADRHDLLLARLNDARRVLSKGGQ